MSLGDPSTYNPFQGVSKTFSTALGGPSTSPGKTTRTTEMNGNIYGFDGKNYINLGAAGTSNAYAAAQEAEANIARVLGLASGSITMPGVSLNTGPTGNLKTASLGSFSLGGNTKTDAVISGALGQVAALQVESNNPSSSSYTSGFNTNFNGESAAADTPNTVNVDTPQLGGLNRNPWDGFSYDPYAPIPREKPDRLPERFDQKGQTPTKPEYDPRTYYSAWTEANNAANTKISRASELDNPMIRMALLKNKTPRPYGPMSTWEGQGAAKAPAHGYDEAPLIAQGTIKAEESEKIPTTGAISLIPENNNKDPFAKPGGQSVPLKFTPVNITLVVVAEKIEEPEPVIAEEVEDPKADGPR